MVLHYSNTEVDLKLQNLEAMNQTRFEKIVGLVQLIDKDINYLKWILATVVLPLVVAIIIFLFTK